MVAHGVVGGTSAELQGGDFGSGFFGAAIAKAATGPINAEFGDNLAAATVATAVVGGTVSRISGGKFANGAVTAAYGYLFNQVLSERQREPDYVRDRLEGYVKLSQVRGLIDSAIKESSFLTRLRGRAGLVITDDVRYILTDAGFIDLRHVVSAATGVGAAVGLTPVLGLAVEITQIADLRAPLS